MPFKRIAERLGISVATAHAWTRDIELTPEQQWRNIHGPRGPADPEAVAARAAAWSEKHRNRRRTNQVEGRVRARLGDPLHMAGCMLYWAEGSKARNTLGFTNSDEHMMRFMRRLPRSCLRGHSLNHFPTSSSGRKRTLPYGVCKLSVLHSTSILQHIYGAIQEYGGFDEPGWLD